MEKNATIEIKDISFALHILILSNREFIIVRKLFKCTFFYFGNGFLIDGIFVTSIALYINSFFLQFTIIRKLCTSFWLIYRSNLNLFSLLILRNLIIEIGNISRY